MFKRLSEYFLDTEIKDYVNNYAKICCKDAPVL